MFDWLTRYLFEHRQLAVPQIGVFELKPKGAGTDLAADTVLPPGWTVLFSEGQAIDSVANDSLYNWLAANQGISQEEAINRFEVFAAELKAKLDNAETVEWTGLGRLMKESDTIVFVPEQEKISPFTQVSAKKITREHTNYATIVGDKETTSAQMREQLQESRKTGQGGNKLMWILLTVSVIAAAIYFSQNGCNTQGAGNKQKVKVTAPGDTYRIE